jgi:hypothetical protein
MALFIRLAKSFKLGMNVDSRILMSVATSGILLLHTLKIQLRTDKLWEMKEF